MKSTTGECSSLSMHQNHLTSKETQVEDLHQDESCQAILKALGCSITSSKGLHELTSHCEGLGLHRK